MKWDAVCGLAVILLLISKRSTRVSRIASLIPLDRIDKSAVVEFLAQSRFDHILGSRLSDFRVQAVLRH